MNIKKMLQISIMAAVCFGMGTISAMNEKKEEVVVCKKFSKDRKYAVIGNENDGYFCEINGNTKVLLEGYEPAKKDVIAISKNGQFVGIIQTKEIFIHRPYNKSKCKDIIINNRTFKLPVDEFRVQGYIAKITLWNTKDGSKKYEMEFQIYSVDFENIRLVDVDNSGSSFIILYNNGMDRNHLILSFSEVNSYSLKGYGDTHFLTGYFSFVLRDFTNKTLPIAIDYKNYEDTSIAKIDKRYSNTMNLVYEVNGKENMRSSNPHAVYFLPKNNHLILAHNDSTDVVTFDPTKGTMKGYVLPFAINKYGLILSGSKAILTDGKKNIHKIYYNKNDENSEQKTMVKFTQTGDFFDLIVE